MVKFCYAIAGSEATGGAGIQTDLRTFQQIGCFGVGTLTCIVSFDPANHWAHRLFPIPAQIIQQQFEAATSAIKLPYVKIGMLGTVENVQMVAQLLPTQPFREIVLDPVLICKGQEQSEALQLDQALIKHVLPLATVITPNLSEAETLTHSSIDSLPRMKDAARAIADMGPQIVVIKGGNKLSFENSALDLFYDGDNFQELRKPLVKNAVVSGAGCTFASAICAYLSLGQSALDAVIAAKTFVHRAIENSFPTAAPFLSINQIPD
jgi:pyridoxine kinase